MSMEAMRAWEEHSSAHGATYTVGKQLAIWAQPETNLCWAENPRIATACHVSVRTVQRAITSLEIAGEIVRQPPAPGRRRAFVIDPKAAGQLPLFADRGRQDVVVKRQPVTPERPAGGDSLSLKGDIHGRACMKDTKDINSTPLTPQGGDLAGLLASLGQDTSPPVAASLPKVGARRRRRSPEPVACEPCPLPDDALDPTLAGVWPGLAERFSERLGHIWQVWGEGAHPHGARDGQLVIAVAPDRAQWAAGRCGAALARVAGVPVAVVACEALAVSR